MEFRANSCLFMNIHSPLQCQFRAMAAMLSRKSGIFYTDFGYDYSCLVIRNGVIIFQNKQNHPYHKGNPAFPRIYYYIYNKIFISMVSVFD